MRVRLAVPTFGGPVGRCRRQCQQRLPRHLVVDGARFGDRRARRRKQAAVERRHDEASGATTPVREPRDRLQRLPQARHLARTLRALAQRFDCVALAIDRMPVGHEVARLGKHEEEHAVHDGERLVEQPREARVCAEPHLLRPPSRCWTDSMTPTRNDRLTACPCRAEERMISSTRGDSPGPHRNASSRRTPQSTANVGGCSAARCRSN